jgi:hypothetical protein
MDLRDLFEAPISDFHHIGDFTKNSSFKAQDRKLVTAPKALTKIKAQWRYPEETEFNIIFVNSADARKHMEVGIVTIDWLHENMPRDFAMIEDALDNDKANIIFTNNNGAERVPMTGWVMAHRVGHALEATTRRGSKDGAGWYMTEAMKEFRLTITDILGDWYGIRTKGRFLNDFPQNGPWLGFLREVCTFKSARENNIRNPFEVPLECLAQYMFTGEVKFNPVPKRFKYGPSWYGCNAKPDEYDYLNQRMEDMGFMMRDYYETALSYCDGKIFLM